MLPTNVSVVGGGSVVVVVVEGVVVVDEAEVVGGSVVVCTGADVDGSASAAEQAERSAARATSMTRGRRDTAPDANDDRR